MILYKIFYYLVLWVDILPIFLFLLKRKKFIPTVFLYPLVSAIVQCSSHFLAIQGRSSFWMVNLYIIFLGILFFLYFRNQIEKKYNYISMYIPFFVFTGIYMIEFNLHSLMQKSLIASAICYVIWSIIALVGEIKNPKLKVQNSFNSSLFNISILIYFSGSIVLFFVFNHLNSNNYNVWTIHNILEIISKLIISYVIWKLPSKSIY